MTAWTEDAIRSKGLTIRANGGVKPATDVVRVEVPLPPSVNMAWQNVPGKGRVRSPEYRRWHKLAYAELISQKPARVVGKFAALISIGRVNRRCDIDNRIKPILDLLKGDVIEDDSMCERVSAGWSDTIESGRVVVEIRRAA
jgi:Holliday junction resolvase RusA-like endonuclease